MVMKHRPVGVPYLDHRDPDRGLRRPVRRLDYLILTMVDGKPGEIVTLSLREGVDFLDEEWPEFGDFYILETA